VRGPSDWVAAISRARIPGICAIVRFASDRAVPISRARPALGRQPPNLVVMLISPRCAFAKTPSTFSDPPSP
jgi:hypothetical protein